MYRKNMYDRISEERERKERLERERLAQEALKPPPPERFLANEVSFVRPESLKDKTFHVFTLTDIGISPFSLVVGRSPAQTDDDLETLAQQLLVELKKSLAHVQWIEPVSPVRVARLDARRVEFRWRQQGQPVHQVQVIFMHHDEHKRPLLMQVTGTSNNPKGMTPEERSTFDAVVQSLELRSLPFHGEDSQVSSEA